MRFDSNVMFDDSNEFNKSTVQAHLLQILYFTHFLFESKQILYGNYNGFTITHFDILLQKFLDQPVVQSTSSTFTHNIFFLRFSSKWWSKKPK